MQLFERMKKSKLIVLSLVAAFTGANAQEQVVMTINGKPIKKSEFEAVYRKNNGREVSNTNKSVKEYVDLFSLFKSKVFEAEALGLDTLSTFRNELAGYRRQLAAPYLTDKNTNENLLTEAYERLKTEVRASHILVRVEENALPKDTLEAWTRISIIRNAVNGKMPTAAEIANYDKLLKNSSAIAKKLKEKDSIAYKARINAIKNLADYYKSAADKFQDVASKLSDEPGAADTKGDLNYFSALDMVYPFETAAYQTPVGEVSPIVRTRFGYHILKVYDKRAARGEMTASHIMVKFAKNATDADKANAKTKVDEIYAKLKAGQSFEELARQFSDDKQSADRGGMLQPFKSGRWPKAFEDAAFALSKNGDVSEPVQSPYGWHIIKRNDVKSMPAFNDMKAELKNKVARDSRSQMGRVALIEKVKKEAGFKENLKNRDELLKVIDSSFTKATWKAESASKLGNKEVFVLAGKVYGQNDFAKYLESQMSFRPGENNFADLVKNIYKSWVNESVINYEDSQLENKYTDFANLYREYRDGILLFDLTDQKVWSKAVKDTAGLRAYYEKNKTKYMWDERAEVTTYKCLNDKVVKDLRKLLKAGKTEKEIVDQLNKSSQLNVSVDNITYLKGESKALDANWAVGVLPDQIDDRDKSIKVMVINKILPKTPKTLGECRGNVTADYQTFLDEDWLAYLKKKYQVKVDEAVLNTIK